MRRYFLIISLLLFVIVTYSQPSTFRAGFKSILQETPANGGTYAARGLFLDTDGLGYNVSDIKVDTTLLQDNRGYLYRIVYSDGGSPLLLEFDLVEGSGNMQTGTVIIGDPINFDTTLNILPEVGVEINDKNRASSETRFREKLLTGGIGGSSLYTVTSPGHSFIVGDLVAPSPSGWYAANANMAGDSIPLGMIIKKTANTFSMYLDTITLVQYDTVAVGDYMFVHEDGLLYDTPDSLNLPVLRKINSDNVFHQIDWRPYSISGVAGGSGSSGTDDQIASEVPISDVPGNYVGSNVEAALEEIADSLALHRTDIASISGSGITDGDKGDITVSGGGATLNIDPGVVGPTELASTGVTPGAYTNANITIGSDGRISAAANGTGGAEVNDLTSAVTWANIPDANVSESAVTQHEAALTITTSQISDFQSAQINKAAPEGSSIVLILTGQSNADGRALDSDATVDELSAQSHIQIWNDATNNFEALDIGANNQSDLVGRHGIELGLAKYIPEYIADTIYLIKHATGGTEIRYWLPGGTGYTELFNDFINPAIDTLNSRSLTPYVSVIWMQGETDAANQTGVDNYASALDSLIDIYRANLSPKVPFYISEVYEGNQVDQNLNNVFNSFEDTVSQVRVLSTGHVPTPDNLHWGYTGQKDVAQGFVRLMNNDGFLGGKVRQVDTIPDPPPPPGGGSASLLNEYPGALMAWSLRLLDSTYTGYCVEVRRASDNTTQLIGYSGGIIDTTALKTFCAGTDGFVKNWYSPTGAYTATQNTEANQPQIVSSGSLIYVNGLPSIQFDGINDGLAVTHSTSILQDFSLFSVIDKTLSGDVMIALGVQSDGFFQAYWADGNVYMNFGGGTNIRWTLSATSGQTLLSTLRDDTSGAITTYQDGSILTQNLGSTSTDDEYIDWIGRRTTTASYGKGRVQEIVLYNSLKTSDRSAIENNINLFYGIF